MKTHPDMLPLGSPAPDFSLPSTDGTTYRLSDLRVPVFVYVQGCNHCPYVLAYLERLKDLSKRFEGRAQLVMVNSNDAQSHPEDAFGEMVAFAEEHALPFPYLYDETQEVARAYRTFRTPEVLVFDEDRRLAYRGRIDDNAKEPERVTQRDLEAAVGALLAGERVPDPETYAVGCTVKWKPGNAPL
jgi:peroxiredoxin